MLRNSPLPDKVHDKVHAKVHDKVHAAAAVAARLGMTLSVIPACAWWRARWSVPQPRARR